MNSDGKMIFNTNHFANKDSMNYFFTGLQNKDIYELVTNKKDSCLKLYSYHSPKFSKSKENWSKIEDEENLDTLGRLYLFPETFVSLGSKTFLLLTDYNKKIYIYETENYDNDLMSHKNITAITSNTKIPDSFNNVKVLDSIVTNNKINHDFSSSKKIGFEKNYTFYYQISIDDKSSNFKYYGTKSSDINNQFSQIYNTKNSILILDNANYGYADSTGTIYQNEIGNMKIYKLSVK